MGAGISKQRKYGLSYRAAKKLQRWADSVGVPTIYRNREVFPAISSVHRPTWRAFLAWFGPASNGESFAYFVIEIYGPEQPVNEKPDSPKTRHYVGCFSDWTEAKKRLGSLEDGRHTIKEWHAKLGPFRLETKPD